MILGPPGDPNIKCGFSFFRTIVGVIALNILLFGCIEFASLPITPKKLGYPGFELKSSISLFRKNPDFSTKTFDPKLLFKVVVTETEFPSLSIIEK